MRGPRHLGVARSEESEERPEGAERTPHPPFGHLLPQGEKAKERLPGGRWKRDRSTSPSPLAGEGGRRPDEGCSPRTPVAGRFAPIAQHFVSRTPHPALRATFSRKGRRGVPPFAPRPVPAAEPAPVNPLRIECDRAVYRTLAIAVIGGCLLRKAGKGCASATARAHAATAKKVFSRANRFPKGAPPTQYVPTSRGRS